MKKYIYTPLLVALLTAFTTVSAQNNQEYLGLPGDNLNLFAVMKLFQESETLEGFERSLNDQNSYINNLDLNGDGYVDYIRVIDNVDRNVHFIVLQVSINPRENQDVAVFTVVREPNGDVTIQLVGDEALYGKNYIIEPIYDETPNPGYTGNARKVNGHKVTVVHTTTYQVAAWPVIRFIFTPTYVVWRSPWYWNYYPSYWRPWSPYYWHHYYGYHYNYSSWYYGHYRVYHIHRHNHWHNTYYVRHHVHSPYVRTRINDGYYKKTYTKPETRKEGVAMYQKTRKASAPSRSAATTAGARRTSESATVKSTTGTRQPTTTTGVRRSTTTGSSREANVRTESRTTSSGNNRQATSTSTSTNRQSSGTSAARQSTGTNTEKRSTTAAPATTRSSGQSAEPASRGSEKRTSVSTQKSTRSSSSGQTVTGKSEKRSSGSTSSSGRRSGSSSSSSKSSDAAKSTSKSESTERGSGRR